jgi:FtsH-binding integral membrane protein
MNRAFFIILIPALLVAAGYVAVFRFMGVAAGYPPLMLMMALFFGAMYWLSRRSARKPGATRQ